MPENGEMALTTKKDDKAAIDHGPLLFSFPFALADVASQGTLIVEDLNKQDVPCKEQPVPSTMSPSQPFED